MSQNYPEKIHKGDVGTRLQRIAKDADTGTILDVSTATTLEIILTSPSGVRVVHTATVTNPGSNPNDGRFGWTSALSTDFAEVGIWHWQSRVSWSSAQDWKSDVLKFEVLDNL